MYPPFGSIGPYGTYGNLGLYGALVAYGSEKLTESSPAQSWTEPFSVTDIAAYLRLPASLPLLNDSINDELAEMIVAARERAEILQNRDLVVKQWDRVHDYWPSYRVELRSPLNSVDLVKYRDSDGNYTTLVENRDYIVDAAKCPGILAPPYNATWPTFTPWPSSALLIRYTSGVAPSSPWWADAGARVKSGMKLLIKALYLKQPPDSRIEDMLAQGAVPRVK